MQSRLYIASTVQGRVPIRARRFESIKEDVLGRTYEVSLVFIGEKRSRTLNKTYRNRDKSANVLSFPLSDTSGEIFINVPLAKQQARQQGESISRRVLYLFIHGVLHLKGLTHGATMDTEEKRLLTKYS